MTTPQLPQPWAALGDELSTLYAQACDGLHAQVDPVFPPEALRLRAFEMVPPDAVKVCLLGMAPLPNTRARHRAVVLRTGRNPTTPADPKKYLQGIRGRYRRTTAIDGLYISGKKGHTVCKCCLIGGREARVPYEALVGVYASMDWRPARTRQALRVDFVGK